MIPLDREPVTAERDPHVDPRAGDRLGPLTVRHREREIVTFDDGVGLRIVVTVSEWRTWWSVGLEVVRLGEDARGR